MRGRILNHLADQIENGTRGHIGTGLIGGQYLMRVLTENGRPDLAYQIASQKDYPSWGYMIEHGATTMWELWNGNTADPTMNSGNHVMLVGDLVIWFYEDLAGIKSDPAQPGFKHIMMRPTPIGDLTWVKATDNSPYGKIFSEWRCGGNAGKPGFDFDWRIEIPANTTATVFVPASSLKSVQAGGINPIRFENGRAIFELGSGQYHIVSK
jgi:alpha-L-rhamnosidase